MTSRAWRHYALLRGDNAPETRDWTLRLDAISGSRAPDCVWHTPGMISCPRAIDCARSGSKTATRPRHFTAIILYSQRRSAARMRRVLVLLLQRNAIHGTRVPTAHGLPPILIEPQCRARSLVPGHGSSPHSPPPGHHIGTRTPARTRPLSPRPSSIVTPEPSASTPTWTPRHQRPSCDGTPTISPFVHQAW